MIFRECSIGGKVYRGNHATGGGSSDSDDYNNKSSDEDNWKKHVKPAEGIPPFVDLEINNDLHKKETAQSKALYGFFSNLALCHTVLAAEEDGLIQYKAQSPDEAALVQAAADVGFIFLGREKNILKLQTPHDEHVVEFELLNVLEFTSARKRMSVVLRRLGDEETEGGLILLTKGADNVIFERLDRGDEEVKQITDEHLEAFANEGERDLFYF